MIRKYWFEIFHTALWLLVGTLLFFQQLIGLPVALFAIVLCAAAFAINALHGEVKAAFIILAAPLLMLAALVPLQSRGTLNWVEFHLARPMVQARIDAMPARDGEPRLIGFHMDDRGWQVVGPHLFGTYVNGDYVIETLVYDESGEILRPPAERSAAWIVRAEGRAHFHSILQPLSQSHSVEVTQMGGNWFWVEQIFHYPRPRG